MLREVWLNIEVEKVDTHEGVKVKTLLDSGVTGMFMDKKMAAGHGFRLQKLERTDVILDMLQLQAHNPEINWETGEVKMTDVYHCIGETPS